MSGTPRKTAALIGMYREKEKKSLTTSSSLPALPSGAATTPSKIPVKAAAGLPTVHKSDLFIPSLTMPSASFVPALTSSLPSLPTSPAAPVPAAKPLTKPSTSTSIDPNLDRDCSQTQSSINDEDSLFRSSSLEGSPSSIDDQGINELLFEIFKERDVAPKVNKWISGLEPGLPSSSTTIREHLQSLGKGSGDINNDEKED
ncbi:hypothetical protein F5879DRAFT_994312 [Lentinula edodes]|nr:hypothetical protein F5879DRAFT_994312 [Lentinula edodes]